MRKWLGPLAVFIMGSAGALLLNGTAAREEEHTETFVVPEPIERELQRIQISVERIAASLQQNSAQYQNAA